MKMHQTVSVVILAAGNSSRMNSPKPFLPFNEERNFIEKIVDTYLEAGIGEIILVINADMERRLRLILAMNYPSCNIELVVNRFPEKGRFYSIQKGLMKVSNSFCFIQNIDNPFITGELLQALVKGLTTTNYVVPACRNKDGHPVLIGREVREHILLVKGADNNFRNELKHFTKNQIEWPFDDILANINTREDYRKYFLSSEVAFSNEK